jgi:hypothetical protein
MKPTTPPLPEKTYDLLYRKQVILAADTMGNCTGEKNRLLSTGSYLKVHFDINPVPHGK